MKEYSKQHKKAWEYDAYAFWVRQAGTPNERAAKDAENPVKMLKQHAAYFDRFEGVRVANICLRYLRGQQTLCHGNRRGRKCENRI